MNCQCQYNTEKYIKKVEEMSIESIYEYAEETPIVPAEKVKKTMANNSGYASNIQNYCNNLTTQRDIRMPDEKLPDLVPTQKQARENASFWYEILNPDIIQIFTGWYSFCTYYSSMKEEEIIQLVDAIDTVSGKEDLKLILNDFVTQGQKHSFQVNKTSSNLNDFYNRLSSDFRNFQGIKQAIDKEIGGANGRIATIQKDLETIKEVISTLDKIISGLAIAVGVSFLGIIAGALLTLVTAGGGAIVLVAGSIGVIGGSAALIKYKNERDDQLNQQKKLSNELADLNQVSTVMQTLGNEFNVITQDNKKAAEEAGKMRECWQVMTSNLHEIVNIIDQVKDVEKAKILIRLKMLSAHTMLIDLKELAKKSQQAGLLPIVPDKKTIELWNLPRQWYKQPIDPHNFREHIEASRRLQQFRGYKTAIT